MVVSTRDTVLHLPEDPRIRLAVPGWKVPMKVREMNGEQLLVEIDGPLQVAGATKLGAIAVEVCAPGPLTERFYAGNGNTMTLLSPIKEGRVAVKGEVALRALPYSPDVPFLNQFRRIAFETILDAARLCTEPQPPRHAGTKEDPNVSTAYGEPNPEDFPKDATAFWTAPKAAVTLLDAPDGQPLHVFPASQSGFQLVRLRSEGAWDLVAAGNGPYLMGWVPATPKPDPDAAGGVLGGLLLGRTSKVPFALHAERLKSLPLHRVPAGTEVQSSGVPRARFNEEGYARVERTDGEWSFVTAAVDNDVTVFGWVLTSKLGAPTEP